MTVVLESEQIEGTPILFILSHSMKIVVVVVTLDDVNYL